MATELKTGDKVTIILLCHTNNRHQEFKGFPGVVVSVAAKTVLVKTDAGMEYRRPHDAVYLRSEPVA